VPNRTALPIAPPPSPADHTIDLSTLPAGAMFMRILGVNYVRLKTPDDGDLYVTEHGLPFWPHLQPGNWYAEDWFAAHRTRLEGTGTVYRVPTRPLTGLTPKTIDLVVKWSRVGEDVPLNTFTLQRAIAAEFNTPFEEFSLLEDLRRGEYGPKTLRVRTQKPLAIYVPPERMQLWQTGRSRAKILSKINRHPSVEIDILRSYIMLYQWIDGIDAVAAIHATSSSLQQQEQALKAFTWEVDGDLRLKGFQVADHKPSHLIVRLRNGQLLRRQTEGRLAYAIVDYELLARTPEYDHAVGSKLRSKYFVRQRDRFTPRPKEEFPAHLHPATVESVPYVYGASESTQGQLWVVGNDPELFGYYLPERWRSKQVIMSPKNETYYVQTKDRIHLLWKVSNVGELPAWSGDADREEGLIRHGFNSPFEEFALALEMAARGIRTVHPRAIYATGKYGGMPGCVADARRFELLADALAPDGRPVFPPDQDYITLWGYWRGVDDAQAVDDAPRWTPIDAAQAARAGKIARADVEQIVSRQRAALTAAGFFDANLRGEHILLSYIPEGSFKRDATGEFELCHCNFEFVGRM
jgi:hypothetical protein